MSIKSTSSSTSLRQHMIEDMEARYTSVATGMIASIESPLYMLTKPKRKPRQKKKASSST
jgi:hypothetical protein